MDPERASTTLSTELLLDYIEGLLSPEGRNRVETLLADDEDLRIMAAGAYHMLVEEGKSREELEVWLEGHLPELELPVAGTDSESPAAAPVSRFASASQTAAAERATDLSYATGQPRRSVILIVAAVFFFIIGGVLAWYLIPGVSADSLALEYLEEPYPPLQVSRGTAGDLPLQEAMLTYQQQNYPNAQARFQDIEGPVARYYEGLCLMYQTNPDYSRATTLFEQVMRSESEAYREQARWYLSLASLLLGEQQRATSLLQTIHDADDHYRKAQASVLLSRLK